jgi:pimeloyl-ACP methyl ester carboxylesterase
VVGVDVRFIRLGTGVTVRVAESGPVHGVPLVMLHSWGGSLYMWRYAFDILPAFGIRTIGVDLRGFGLSDRPRERDAYRLDAYCADVDALFDALGVARGALLGHSMGGALAFHYALRRPDRVSRLAVINPAGLTRLIYPTVARAVPRAAIATLSERVISRSLINFILRRLVYGDSSKVTERDVDQYWSPTQLPGFVHAASETLRTFDWRPVGAAVESLAVPTMVVLGRNDRLIRHERARAARLPNAVVHELAGGHGIHEERPREVYELVGSFIR